MLSIMVGTFGILAALTIFWWVLNQGCLHHLKAPPTCVITSKANGTYVERWHLVWRERWMLWVIHRFHGPDLDPPHNHPGPSLTLVLGGSGIETFYDDKGRPVRTRILRKGAVHWRPQSAIHRIDPLPGPPLTTTFLLFPQKKQWGFFTKEGFTPGEDYVKAHETDKAFKWMNRPRKKKRPMASASS